MGYDVRESTPKISIFLTIFEVTETNPSCPAAKRTMRVYNRKMDEKVGYHKLILTMEKKSVD